MPDPLFNPCFTIPIDHVYRAGPRGVPGWGYAYPHPTRTLPAPPSMMPGPSWGGGRSPPDGAHAHLHPFWPWHSAILPVRKIIEKPRKNTSPDGARPSGPSEKVWHSLILYPWGPSWDHPGPSWGHPGAIWARPDPSWGHLGTILGHLGVSLGHLGAIMGPSWGHLGPSWAILSHLGAIFGASWPFSANFGPSWRLGPILGPSWGHLGPSWPILGPS